MSEAKERAQEDLRLLQAEERRIERTTFRECDHDLKDVTEERRALVEGRSLPSWIQHLIKEEMKKPPQERRERWLNRRELWKTQKYEKCTICGLLIISDNHHLN